VEVLSSKRVTHNPQTSTDTKDANDFYKERCSRFIDLFAKNRECPKILFDFAPDIYLICDTKGYVIFCNRTIEVLIGYRCKDIIGKNISDLKILTENQMEKIINSWEFCINDNLTVTNEFKIPGKDDDQIIIEVRSSPVLVNDELLILNIARDITAQKKAVEALLDSEERLRGFAEGSFDIIFCLDTEGEITFASPVVENILGYHPDLLIGKDFQQFVPDFELPKIQRVQTELINGKGFEGLELKLIRKDGSVKDFEVNINPIYKNNEPIGVTGIARDITDRKLVEEEMKRQFMKFDLEEGEIYLVKERVPTLAFEGYNDLLKAGYNGLVISRTPEKHLRMEFEGDVKFLWLSEKQNGNSHTPNLQSLEDTIETLPKKSIVMLDRIDYLSSNNGFKKILTFIYHLKELALIKSYIIIISLDPLTFEKKELRLLEKETNEIELLKKPSLPEHLFCILKYIYQQNKFGIKPSHTEIGQELNLSKPTVRKRVRELVKTRYAFENQRGRNKIIELTQHGLNFFQRV
jgi:PAS domain S-box-containing protein